jgi:hypothetical protein
MSDLASGTISTELYSDTDRIFEGETLPVSASATSAIFKLGKTLDAIEVVGTALTTMAVLSGVQYEYSENSDMSSSTTIDLPFSGAAPAAGAEFFRYTPDHTKPVYGRIIVTGGAAASGTFDVNIGSVRK